MSNEIVKLTEKAIREVRESLAANPDKSIGLRLGIQGGGCSGLSYIIDFDAPKEKDITYSIDSFTVMIDPKSSLYLQDSTLDYSGGLADRGFKFVNPNAENTCGCGESFSL